MDRRTLLFVLLVGITFLGLNMFFSHQRDAKNRAALESTTPQFSEKTASSAAYSARIAPVQDLPLVILSASKQGGPESFLNYGVNVGGATLALAWSSSMPAGVYVHEKYQVLQTPNTVVSGLVVYAAENFTALSLATLPETGAFDVQLVTLSQEGPHVFLGHMEEGKFQVLTGPIFSNAIALYKTDAGWLPVGFYSFQENVLVPLQNLPLLSALVGERPVLPVAGKGVQREEKFYVLQNGYLQLVFSNVGGALAEINLPFQGPAHPNSVVKEIGFDRNLVKQAPDDARFPLHPYYLAGETTLKEQGTLGGYYPLLRRGIAGPTKTFASKYYALNTVSEYPEMAELVYQVKAFSPTSITFEALQPHRRITKTYSLPENVPYSVDVAVTVEGDSRGLWLTSGVPEVEIMSNNSVPQIQYKVRRKEKSVVEKLDLPKVKELVSVASVNPEWMVNSNGYLGIILNPLTEIGSGYRASASAGGAIPTRLSLLDAPYYPFPAAKYPGYEVLIPLPAKGQTTRLRVYAGPFEESVLKKVDEFYTNPQTGANPGYLACRTFYGWFAFISKPFARMLFVVMKFFYNITHSWGFSIILLTVFLRLLLYPLNAWSFKSMRRMQQLSPQIQAIQQKYKKEPKKGQMEIMALYRAKKVNPFTGCIPILIQIPFLIAMFDLLKSSFQLRGAVFIPGWIDNLTAPDVLFQWTTPIFFIGTQFHLLPFLLGGVMFVQQRFFSAVPQNPNQMTDQQRQQRAMGTIMTIVFTVMFYHFPSGLNIYWLSSMLLGIGQQWLTNKVLDRNKPTGENKNGTTLVIVPKKPKGA